VERLEGGWEGYGRGARYMNFDSARRFIIILRFRDAKSHLYLPDSSVCITSAQSQRRASL
jgi:hypothetical protein